MKNMKILLGLLLWTIPGNGMHATQVYLPDVPEVTLILGKAKEPLKVPLHIAQKFAILSYPLDNQDRVIELSAVSKKAMETLILLLNRGWILEDEEPTQDQLSLIHGELQKLDDNILTEVLYASDFLGFPHLVLLIQNMVCEGNPGKFSSQSIEALPRHLTHSLVMHHLGAFAKAHGFLLYAFHEHAYWKDREKSFTDDDGKYIPKFEALSVSSDDKLVFSSQSPATTGSKRHDWICIWDIAHAKDYDMCKITAHIWHWCITKDNKLVLDRGSLGGGIGIWDLTGQHLTDLADSRCENIKGLYSGPRSIFVYVTHCSSGHDRVYLADTSGTLLKTFRAPYSITSICLSSDDNIVYGGHQGHLQVHDMQGKLLHSEKSSLMGHHQTEITRLDATNSHILSWDLSKLKVWDKSLKQQISVEGQAFAVSGDILVVCSRRTVKLWNMTTYKYLEFPRQYSWDEDFSAVCITRNNKIVTGSSNGMVRVWDMEGNLLGKRKAHNGCVTGLCVTKDNKIVSHSWKNSIGIWVLKPTVEEYILNLESAHVASIWDMLRKPYVVGSQDAHNCWKNILTVMEKSMISNT
jgi:hypothetical protein